MNTVFSNDNQVLQAMLDNTGTQLAYLDRDFNFVRVNSAYVQGSGRTEAELIGRNHFDLFPNAENRAVFEKVRDTGEAVTFHDRPFAYADQPARGVTYWDWTLAPVKGEDGRVRGLVLSLSETTKCKQAEEALEKLNAELEQRVDQRTEALLFLNRKLEGDVETRRAAEDKLQGMNVQLEEEIAMRRQMEEDLRESEEKFRRMVETAHEGIWVTDKKEKAIFVNQHMADMLGYGREELTGLDIVDLVVEDQREQLLANRAKLRAGNISLDVERDLYRKDGSIISTLSNVTPLFDEKGKYTGNLRMHANITERKKAEQQLRQIPLRLLKAQETERRNIGRELHDQTGQYLTALKMLISRIKGAPYEKVAPLVDEAKKLTDETIQQVRGLSLNLRPPMLDDLGLAAALLWQFDRVKEQMGLEVDFRQYGLEEAKLPIDVSTAVFRIIQEAITNAARYSGANHVAVEVNISESRMLVKVADRGKGFDPQKVEAGKSSGLSNMRERALLLGGNFSIVSAPGMGTIIAAEIPVGK